MEIQCPCGTPINSPGDYRIIFLKKDLNEIDILCSNPDCYLKELGFIRFISDNEKGLFLERAKFYGPYVTWNATQLGKENAIKILRNHLMSVVRNEIDWQWILEVSNPANLASSKSH